MASIAEQLAAAPVTDSLKHAAQPGSLTLIPWALVVGGWSETTGWNPPSFVSSPPTQDRGGLYLNTGGLTGGNAYSILRLTASLTPAERQVSAYLFSAMGATASGYQCTVYYQTSGGPYTFKLRRWVAGAETLLWEVGGVVLESTGSFAVVATAGKVSMWDRKNEAAAWTLIGAEVADATYTEGKSGFAGNGSNPKFINFSTGVLVPESIEPKSSFSVSARRLFPFAAQSGWAFRKPRGWNHLDVIRATTRQPHETPLPWISWFLGIASSATAIDQIGISDAVQKAPVLARVDTVALTDATAKAPAHVEVDTMSISDIAAKAVSRTSSDEIGFADAPSKMSAHGERDVYALSDAIARGVGHTEVDEFRFEDAVAKGVDHFVEDELLLSDSVGKRIASTLVDVLGFFDDLAKGVTRAIEDFLGLSDSTDRESRAAKFAELEMSDSPAALLKLEDAPNVALDVSDVPSAALEVQDGPSAALDVSDAADASLFLEDFPMQQD